MISGFDSEDCEGMVESNSDDGDDSDIENALYRQLHYEQVNCVDTHTGYLVDILEKRISFGGLDENISDTVLVEDGKNISQEKLIPQLSEIAHQSGLFKKSALEGITKSVCKKQQSAGKSVFTLDPSWDIGLKSTIPGSENTCTNRNLKPLLDTGVKRANKVVFTESNHRSHSDFSHVNSTNSCVLKTAVSAESSSSSDDSVSECSSDSLSDSIWDSLSDLSSDSVSQSSYDPVLEPSSGSETGEERNPFDLTSRLDNNTENRKWKINCQDRMSIVRSSGQSRHEGKDLAARYYKSSTVSCFNCKDTGHLSRDCPKPKKYKICHLCGFVGHFFKDCPNSICYNCDAPGHRSIECMEPKRNMHRECHRCGMPGHTQKMCPDLWRQYHMTTVGTYEKPQKCKKIKNTKVFCCNCGRSKHFGYECQKDRADRFSMPTYPFIVSYEKAKAYQQHKTFTDETPEHKRNCVKQECKKSKKLKQLKKNFERNFTDTKRKSKKERNNIISRNRFKLSGKVKNMRNSKESPSMDVGEKKETRKVKQGVKRNKKVMSRRKQRAKQCSGKRVQFCDKAGPFKNRKKEAKIVNKTNVRVTSEKGFNMSVGVYAAINKHQQQMMYRKR